MYKEIYSFHTPNRLTKIWRYMDFTKFVDLLISNELYFARSDKFEDPFEGLFRLKDYEQTKDMLSDQIPTKLFYFLNCWHMNEVQSDAMWNRFLKTNNGIAIRSTVDDLIHSLEETQEDVHIGKIYYRDFENVTYLELLNEEQNSISNGQWKNLNQYNYKRTSFDYEKEIRLYYVDLPIPHTILDGIPREPLIEKRIKVDLNKLINEIVISPFADDWFLFLIERLIKKVNLNFPINKSTLYKLKE